MVDLPVQVPWPSAEQPKPRPPRLSPAERLQRRCARIACRLRWEIRELRRDLQELEPELPAEHLREGLLSIDHDAYPFCLWASADGLIGEDLCGAIVQLERVASMTPEHPQATARDAFELWRELDPEAPRELAGRAGT